MLQKIQCCDFDNRSIRYCDLTSFFGVFGLSRNFDQFFRIQSAVGRLLTSFVKGVAYSVSLKAFKKKVDFIPFFWRFRTSPRFRSIFQNPKSPSAIRTLLILTQSKFKIVKFLYQSLQIRSIGRCACKNSQTSYFLNPKRRYIYKNG